MRKRTAMLGVAGVAGAAVGAVAAFAPAPTGRGDTVESIAETAASGGNEGIDLVNAAIRAVADAFPQHSAWHLWESPTTSLRHGRGRSPQYNTVLLLVLRRLGFDVRLVHAARVRGFSRPWFLSGHTWVKACVDGRWLDACASSASNKAGEINFVPLTEELPVFIRTRWALGLALTPFVVGSVWWAWLTGKPVPTGLAGERDEPRAH